MKNKYYIIFAVCSLLLPGCALDECDEGMTRCDQNYAQICKGGLWSTTKKCAFKCVKNDETNEAECELKTCDENEKNAISMAKHFSFAKTTHGACHKRVNSDAKVMLVTPNYAMTEKRDAPKTEIQFKYAKMHNG